MPCGRRADGCILPARTYETMVFRDSGKRCDDAECGCERPAPADWNSVDFDGYTSQREAELGHAAMVAKYAAASARGAKEGE